MQSRDDNEFLYGTFPDDFKWGTATASYQVEGAWNKDGRSPSIWDDWCHSQRTQIHHDGDVACDSYHKYREDVGLMKELGAQVYRFSISWSRLLPDGTPASLNPKGVAYYNSVIDEVLANGIEPMVTLYHWDLPSCLQRGETGGWLDAAIVEQFVSYARVCFQQFGDRVKRWTTFNEPYVFVWDGYGCGVFPPGNDDPGKGAYQAAHNVIRAHARTYHMYQKEFRTSQQGVIGITLNSDWHEPFDSNDPRDCQAADDELQFQLGWFACPIFGDGDYPAVMRERVALRSGQQNFSKSRLPEFSAEEIRLNKGSADFFGLNNYTSRLVKYHEQPIDSVSYVTDRNTQLSVDETWLRGHSQWLYVVPWGLRKLLGWISKSYNFPDIWVTENGFSDHCGTVLDFPRIGYYRLYINQVLKAVTHDGVKVKGYLAWSLLDNFEWNRGYSEKFGLHFVDFNDPARPRTPKQSARFYREVILNNGFPKKS